MTALAIACAALVAAACLHVAHRHRSLAERLVDLLYIRAARAYALAQAADAALARYRSAKRGAVACTVPLYMEEQP